MPSQAAEFTTSGTWTCPAGVSAVFLTQVGGGSGAYSSFIHVGGAGGGELVMGRPIPVVPGDDYNVIIGVQGVGGAAHNDLNTPPASVPTGSSFGGFNALGGGAYAGTPGASASGAGGGVGGGKPYVGSNVRLSGIREAGRYFGGCSGVPPPVAGSPTTLEARLGTGQGGVPGYQGIAVGGSSNLDGGGGAGAGSPWGGTDGKDGHMWTANANVAHYGSGAGGSGSTGDESTSHTGGDGAPGYVLIMWSE